METRANFALIGAFTLAVIFAAFQFVYWISGPSGMARYQTYQLVIRGSVEGLTKGSAVQFNGLKVGEVTSLEINKEDPSLVDVLISIDKNTPVKTDTRARLKQTGLTGVPIVLLVGATPEAPNLVARPGEAYPRIAVEPSELQSLLETVQRLAGRGGEVLDKLDALLDANSPTITASLKNVETFTRTLADNSDAVGNFIHDAAELAHSLKPGAERLDRLIADADRTVKALDPKTVKSIAGNINRFSQSGLRQYEQLAVEGRQTLDSLNRAVRNFERDPSQVIFGPSSALPEVRGQ